MIMMMMLIDDDADDGDTGRLSQALKTCLAVAVDTSTIGTISSLV